MEVIFGRSVLLPSSNLPIFPFPENKSKHMDVLHIIPYNSMKPLHIDKAMLR